ALFFFQAEDGIRDRNVTGVQTCALPISTTLNLARMNMILHNVGIGQQNFRNGDTLDDDWPTDEPTNFDLVLMNPPYSAKWPASRSEERRVGKERRTRSTSDTEEKRRRTT